MLTFEERLERIESLLAALVERQQVREFYAMDEFARTRRAGLLHGQGNGHDMVASGQ